MLALIAVAQVVPPPPLAAPTVRAPAEVDAVRLAAAKRLLGMMKLEQTFDRMFVQLAPGFAQGVIGVMATEPDTKDAISALIARDPGNRDRMIAILSQEFLGSIQQRYPRLLARAAEEYAAAFTTEELTAIADFYATGAGAKALALMPQLQTSIGTAGQALGREAGEEAGRRAFAKIAHEMLPAKDVKS